MQEDDLSVKERCSLLITTRMPAWNHEPQFQKLCNIRWWSYGRCSWMKSWAKTRLLACCGLSIYSRNLSHAVRSRHLLVFGLPQICENVYLFEATLHYNINHLILNKVTGSFSAYIFILSDLTVVIKI